MIRVHGPLERAGRRQTVALSDKEIGTVLELFNRRRLEDPAFARLADENPVSAFDQLAKAHELELAAAQESFPLPVQGRALTLEALAGVTCRL